MAGRGIGNYQIIADLPPGSLGPVYLARPLGQLTEVVIRKIPFAGLTPTLRAQLKARLRRVVWMQLQLRHPAITRLLEHFQTEQACYLVSEYVAGTTLGELLRRQGRPTPAQALKLCRQALAALDHAHQLRHVDEADIPCQGLLHGDLTPENIIIDGTGRLHLTGFGLVNLPGNPAFAYTGFRPGTIEYLAPELLRGGEPDPRADIFSLGVIIYELLTGYHPYLRTYPRTGSPDSPFNERLLNDAPGDGQPAQGTRLYFDSPPPRIDEVRPDLPPGLARLLMPALDRRVGGRYASAASFLQAIVEYDAGSLDDEMAEFSGGPADAGPGWSVAARGDDAGDVPDPVEGRPRRPGHSGALPEISRSGGEAGRRPPRQSGESMLPREPVVIPLREGAASGGGRRAGSERMAEPGMAGPEKGREARRSAPHTGRTGRRSWWWGLVLIFGLGLAGWQYMDPGGWRQLIGRDNWGWLVAGDPGVGPAGLSEGGDATSTGRPGVVEPTPASTAGAAEAATQDGRLAALNRLAAAREADQNGRFAQAVQLYEEYLAMGAVATESRDVAPYVEKLRNFIGHLEAARLALERRELAAARSGYLEALKLRPSSGFARAGLAEVEELLKAAEAPNQPAPVPPPATRPERLSLTPRDLFQDWQAIA